MGLHQQNSEAYLAERYEAARVVLAEPGNRRVDKITAFMLGAKWEQDHQKRPEPVNAEAGPHKMTVGDLSASMIGRATIRVESEGASVQGTLADLKIEADTRTLQDASGGHRDVIYRVSVSLTIGQIEFHDLRVDHPVEVLS